MQFKKEQQSIQLNSVELSGLIGFLQKESNPLGILAASKITGQEQTGVETEWKALDEESRSTVTQVFGLLAKPEQTIELKYIIADEQVFQTTAAMGKGKDIALLTPMVQEWEVSITSVSDLQHLLTQVLAANVLIEKPEFELSLSAIATLVCVAILDAYRRGYYQAVLSHISATTTFMLSEIMHELKNVNSNDFRWPLTIFNQVLPEKVLQEINQNEVTAGLDELCQAGLLLKIEGENKKEETLYSLTLNGEILAWDFLRSISKVAMRVSRLLNGKRVGHEALLLLRSERRLWLVDMGGNQGMIADLSPDKFQQVLLEFFNL
jgi:DNA-binding HxlR family transcriptional regulator